MAVLQFDKNIDYNNFHQLWDRGLGLCAKNDNLNGGASRHYYKTKASQLIKMYDGKIDNDVLRTSPEAWMEESI